MEALNVFKGGLRCFKESLFDGLYEVLMGVQWGLKGLVMGFYRALICFDGFS